MSKKREMEVRHKTDEIEAGLMARDVAHLRNENSGWLESGVRGELRRRHPSSDLVIEEPLRGFGGEYTFRSAAHLGTKPEGSAE